MKNCMSVRRESVSIQDNRITSSAAQQCREAESEQATDQLHISVESESEHTISYTHLKPQNQLHISAEIKRQHINYTQNEFNSTSELTSYTQI
jgi:hypothetical protein